MKNKTHEARTWKRFIAAALLGVVGANNALAGGNGNDCENSFELTLTPPVTMKFCDIPAAQDVLIGSENGPMNERPVKPRNFKNFQIGQFEVTQLQYKTLTNSEPWIKNGKVKTRVQEGDDYPAVYVSYREAQLFADLLNLIDKTAYYRLPTEAEFEYATRAGTTTKYFWGDDEDTNYAYFLSNSEKIAEYGRKVDSCPNPIIHKISPGYCANGFGLYHMLGNVAEWTADADLYHDYVNAPTDGNTAVKGQLGSYRIMRGGDYHSTAEELRSGYRSGILPEKHYSSVGFRLVRTAK